MFAELFSSNGRLCWLHSSSLEQICHNMKWQMTIVKFRFHFGFCSLMMLSVLVVSISSSSL
jgi:hypothetical protein